MGRGSIRAPGCHGYDEPIARQIPGAVIRILALSHVPDHLLQVHEIDDPVPIEVPSTGEPGARAVVPEERQQVDHVHGAVAVEVHRAVCGVVARSEAEEQREQVRDVHDPVPVEVPGARRQPLQGTHVHDRRCAVTRIEDSRVVCKTRVACEVRDGRGRHRRVVGGVDAGRTVGQAQVIVLGPRHAVGPVRIHEERIVADVVQPVQSGEPLDYAVAHVHRTVDEEGLAELAAPGCARIRPQNRVGHGEVAFTDDEHAAGPFNRGVAVQRAVDDVHDVVLGLQRAAAAL